MTDGDVRLLADEHVDSTYVTVLRSNGYDVATVGDDYESGTADLRLLEIAFDDDRTVLANDRDFIRVARNHEHAGVIVYDQGVAVSDVVTAIERIERFVPAEERGNHPFWLEQWIR